MNYKIIVPLIILFSYVNLFSQNAGDQLFDDTYLHQITIDSDDFDNKDDFVLELGNFNYILVSLTIDGQVLDSVGIRKKGGISSTDQDKPPIKVDINKFVSGQKYDGLKKFNLQNNFSDDIMQRDKIAYNLYRRAGVVGPRATFAEIFFKNESLGIYTMSDQIDRTFLKENFASDEGSLIKGAFNSVDLKYGNLSDYTNYIDNATATNYGDYVNLETYLKLLAIDVLIEDWDSYGYERHNYYVYFEPKSERINFITWDHNFAFDVFNSYANRLYPKADIDIINHPPIKAMYHSTMCNLLQYLVTDSYIDSFLLHNETLLNTNTSSITIPSSALLNQYLKDSRQWLLNELANEGVTCEDLSFDYDQTDIVINEFVAKSDSIGGVQEPNGGYPDWIELYNNTNTDIILDKKFYLSDDKDFPKKWNFSNEVTLPANDYLMVWADRDIHQSGIHTNFKIEKNGGELLLTYEDLTEIQHISYDEQTLNFSYSRIPNGTGNFIIQTSTFNLNNETMITTDDISPREINIFPNPATDFFWIKSKNTINEIELYNAIGQSILKIETPDFPIDLSGLKIGQYFIKIKTNSENVIVKALIKQ
ncbi:MAG: CotH kinase family protein [Saprospiraceae bacterium]